jgi:hypothetical protein
MRAHTVQEINDAKTDLDNLEQIVNVDASTTVTTRLGGDKPSVSRALSDDPDFGFRLMTRLWPAFWL